VNLDLIPEKYFPLRKKPVEKIQLLKDKIEYFQNYIIKKGEDNITEFEKVQFAELLKNLELIEKKLKDDFIYYWKPNPVQIKFVTMMCYGRILRGGNRLGKTEVLFYDYILRCLGIHPAQKLGLYPKPPLSLRVVVPDFNAVKLKAEPLCRKFIPPYEFEKYDSESYVFYFKSGSLLEVKSNEQDVLKHAQVDRLRIGFDEPCRKVLFGENLTRVASQKFGGFDFVQTPDWSNSAGAWIRTDLLPEAKRFPEAGATGITEIRGNWRDNRENLDEDGIQRWLSSLSDAERKVRETGEFPEGSSLLFGDQFIDGVHSCQPFKIPRNRLKFGGMDMGIGCPTVHLWAFVGDYSDITKSEVNKCESIIKKPVLFIYREYYQRGKTIPENAGEIKRLTSKEEIQLTLLDPKSGSKRDEQTGETRQSQWMDAGIPTLYGATSVEAGLNAVAALMVYGEKDFKKRKYPRIIIFTSCVETIKELKKSTVDDLKKTDAMHCISVLRWLASAKLLENWLGVSAKIKGACYSKKETQEYLRKRRASLPRKI